MRTPAATSSTWFNLRLNSYPGSAHQGPGERLRSGDAEKHGAQEGWSRKKHAHASSVAKGWSKLFGIANLVLPMGLLQGAFALEERNDGLGGERAAMQGERNAVSCKWIDKAGCIACQEHSFVLCLRAAKVERRGCNGIENRFPIAATSPEVRILGENFVQRPGDIGPHHGGGIHGIASYRLDTTITSIKEIQVNRMGGSVLIEMRLQSNPLLVAVGELSQLRPAATGIDQHPGAGCLFGRRHQCRDLELLSSLHRTHGYAFFGLDAAIAGGLEQNCIQIKAGNALGSRFNGKGDDLGSVENPRRTDSRIRCESLFSHQ